MRRKRLLKNYMSGLATQRNFHFISIGNDFSHMLEIQKALENKEIIAIHGDRFLPGNKTTKIDFLGEPVLFPVGPWQMASFFKVPVSYVFSIRDSRWQYRVYATPLTYVQPALDASTREEMFMDSMKEYVSELEKVVRKYPLQWF